MSSGTEAVRGRQWVQPWKKAAVWDWVGGMLIKAKKKAMEGNCYLCYIPNSNSLRKKKPHKITIPFYGTGMLSNYLLIYLNFYAIIHFPKHLCCLQPKADFRSEPLSLFSTWQQDPDMLGF